ncbi:hypothetical protein ACTFRR_15130, partial [Bacteroides xylanisolvens]
LLIGLVRKYSFNHIGIECANAKSSSFVKKSEFDSIDGENYSIIVDKLKSYLFNGKTIIILSFSKHKNIFQE